MSRRWHLTTLLQTPGSSSFRHLFCSVLWTLNGMVLFLASSTQYNVFEVHADYNIYFISVEWQILFYGLNIDHIYLSFVGHLSCFQLQSTIDNVVVNLYVQVSFRVYSLIFPECIPKSRILGQLIFYYCSLLTYVGDELLTCPSLCPEIGKEGWGFSACGHHSATPEFTGPLITRNVINWSQQFAHTVHCSWQHKTQHPQHIRTERIRLWDASPFDWPHSSTLVVGVALSGSEASSLCLHSKSKNHSSVLGAPSP